MPDIDNEIAKAKKISESQSQERAGSLSSRSPGGRSASRRSAFFNIASGTAAGVQAAQQAIQSGDPLSAAILGMGGALQAPTFEQVQAAREAQIADSTLKRLEATPIEQISPNILREYPEFEGMPLGAISKLSPLVRQQEQYSNAMSLMLLRDKLRDEDRFLNDVEVRQLSDLTGYNSATLKGIRSRELSRILPKPIFNPVTGEVTILDPRTQIATPPGGTDALQKISKGEAYLSALEKLEQVFSTVPSGRIVGRGGELINTLTGRFPQVREAKALINALIPQTARFIGGDVGNLNENEQERAAVALQLIDGTVEERRRGLALLRGLTHDVLGRERQKLSFGSGAKDSGGGDIRSEARRILEERRKNKNERP